MASLAFFEPLTLFATLANAANFGGSSLQSPLIVPIVQDHVVDVPTHYCAQQMAHLLQTSEFYFPPTNGLSTLSNLILTGTAYYNRDSPVFAAKLPVMATAFGFNLLVTAYALGIMVPMNKRMVQLSKEMKKAVGTAQEKDSSFTQKEMEFRQIQQKWKRLNLGRAMCMVGAAVAGAYSLLV